jgi:hypothetical protein
MLSLSYYPSNDPIGEGFIGLCMIYALLKGGWDLYWRDRK